MHSTKVDELHCLIAKFIFIYQLLYFSLPPNQSFGGQTFQHTNTHAICNNNHNMPHSSLLKVWQQLNFMNWGEKSHNQKKSKSKFRTLRAFINNYKYLAEEDKSKIYLPLNCRH